MLAVGHRLRRRDEFAATIKAGRRAGRGGVVVHLVTRPRPSAQPLARAGFVVSKAVGNAVVRNRVRRRLRHLIRARLTSLPAGTDVVVRAAPSAAGRNYRQLGADLDAAITAARAKTRGAKAGMGV